MANKMAWDKPEIRQRYLLAFEGRPVDTTRLTKMQKAHRVCRCDPEWIAKLSLACSHPHGRNVIKDPTAFRKQQSINSRKRIFTPEYRKHLSQAAKNRSPMSEETKHRISVAHKVLWQNPEYARRVALARRCSPNKSEQKLSDILLVTFGQDWRYVGNGEVWLGGRNPDFINTNGKKKIIELFSLYWHKERARTKDDTKDRIEHYKQYGFGCLVVWQSELKDEEKLIKKIREFTNEPTC